MEKANQRLNKISDEVVELTKSFEFTQVGVKEEIAKIKDNLNKIKTQIQEFGEDVLHPDYVTNKLIEFENPSRCTTSVLMEFKKRSMKQWADKKKNYRRLSKKN